MIPLVPSEDDGGSGSEILGEAAMWKESLARVIPAIVVVRVCSVSAFDTESTGYGKATGFVVDKTRGIILTNRHVVTPGASLVVVLLLLLPLLLLHQMMAFVPLRKNDGRVCLKSSGFRCGAYDDVNLSPLGRGVAHFARASGPAAPAQIYLCVGCNILFPFPRFFYFCPLSANLESCA